MKVTTAICTWNRAMLLGNTLQQMQELIIPKGLQWELIVVNNNSTDHTDQVIASFATKLPIIRIFEPTPGLSNARNAAVRAASGEYIIWTDDDVLVDKHWILAYVKAFHRWADAAVFGGPVTPWFEGTTPKWITEAWSELASAFAARDLGSVSFQLRRAGNLIPYGANYAIRMCEQREYLYARHLGVRPGSLMGGEEVEVITAILNERATGWWVPQAKVSHWIPRTRQTLSYIWRYAVGQGRYKAELHPDCTSARLFGCPRYLYRRLVLSAAMFLFHRIFSCPEIWVRHFLSTGGYFGEMTK